MKRKTILIILTTLAFVLFLGLASFARSGRSYGGRSFSSGRSSSGSYRSGSGYRGGYRGYSGYRGYGGYRYYGGGYRRGYVSVYGCGSWAIGAIIFTMIAVIVIVSVIKRRSRM